jgi:cell division septation protein DedD
VTPSNNNGKSNDNSNGNGSAVNQSVLESLSSSTNMNNLIPEIRVAAQTPAVQNQAALQPPPVSADKVQIIPGLPDRNSGGVFSLQVGAYSSQEMAYKAAGLLNGAGFNVSIEFSGAIYRVMATGIASYDVYAASARMGSLGFAQVWVRE